MREAALDAAGRILRGYAQMLRCCQGLLFWAKRYPVWKAS